jgi:hypothetical protein
MIRKRKRRRKIKIDLLHFKDIFDTSFSEKLNAILKKIHLWFMKRGESKQSQYLNRQKPCHPFDRTDLKDINDFNDF